MAGAYGDLRNALIETCQAMNRLQINKGTSGNVSVRVDGGFLISPTGVVYDRLTPDLIVHMHMDGTFDGDVLPSSEWRFHRDILHTRADLNAIVHTHSTHATALAIMGMRIPALHYSIAAVGGHDIRCARYATFGTQELSDAALVAMEGRRACLLAHHGVIAAHADLSRALSLAVLIEELAKQYLLCRSLGEPPVLDDAEIERVLVKYRSYGQQRAAL
ncbi:MAG TPA: class II aldolase/adducin family protein [Vineibacter sp.]|nr:class II aldolase/adducin family protein [Vineibacter sp.]